MTSRPLIGSDRSVKSEKELSEFIERRKEQRKRAKASSAEPWQQSLKLATLIKSQGTSFWGRLLEKLESTVSALHEIDFTGSVSPFGEDIVRVSVNNRSLAPIHSCHSWTDLVRDGDRIRCSVLNGGIYYLDFVAISDAELALQDIQQNGDSMDEEKTAVYVIERMVNIIERVPVDS
jgi:hypothetical protein